jgi:heptosyltransferase-2
MSDRVLVRAPNWVGDAIMALPFFVSLRTTLRDAEITCLCRSSLSALFESVPAIDRVLCLDESRGRSGFASIRLNAARLREEQFDIAFSLPSSFGATLMLWLARIPRRFGHAAEARGPLLTDSLPYGPNGKRPHRAEGYLSLLRLAFPGATIVSELTFSPPESARAMVAELWPDSTADKKRRVLALAPGAAQPNKMWASERFAHLAQRWLEDTEGTVVLVGGPVERERSQQIAEAVGSDRIIDLTGAGDLAVAAEIIRRADVFVGNDSGLAHLSATVGTRTVVISGPGDPTEVAPFSPLAVTVKRPLFCSPCYKNVCWRKDKPLECLTEISVDEVWQHVVRLAADETHSSGLRDVN